MKLVNVVKQARERGFRVSYRRRTDGGIIIKSINGRKYEGVRGNKIIRILTGRRLSKESISQRKKVGFKNKPLEKFTTENLLRKAQREWRKANIIIKGTQSRLSIEDHRKNIKLFGEEDERAKLWENIQYSRGIAYDKNVEFWSEKLITSKDDFEDSSFTDRDEKTGLTIEERLEAISQYLDENKGNIKESDIKEIHELYYNHQNHLISDKEYVESLEELLF